MPFRFAAKTVFLTYAQVNNAFTHQDLFNHLRSLRDVEPICLRVGRESHQDGGIHFHVFGKWSQKIDTIDPRYFDYRGIHPNVQSARKESDVYTYCGKDGDTLDFGIPPKIKRTWTDVINDSTTKEEFMKGALDLSSRDYVLNHERLEYFAAKHFKPEVKEYVDPYNGQFNIPDILDQWVSENLQSDNIGKYH